MRLFRSFLRNERGATAVEYGLIIAVLSLAMIAGFSQFSNALLSILGILESRIDQPVP